MAGCEGYSVVCTKQFQGFLRRHIEKVNNNGTDQNTHALMFVCFVALRPKSTAMVMVGESVNLTTLFLGKLEQAVAHTFAYN